MKPLTPRASCFAVALVALSALLGGPVSGCTTCALSASDCDVVNADFVIKSSLPALIGGTIHVCTNGSCFDATMIGISTVCNKDTCSTGYASSPETADEVQCGSTGRCDAKSTKDGITLNVAIGFPAHYKDGDFYSVTVTANDGTVLAHREGKVDYHTEHLQGPFCPACQQATLAEAGA